MVAIAAEAVVEVTTEEDEPPEDPRGPEVRAAFSKGVEGADEDDEDGDVEVPRMEDMEKFPGPVGLKQLITNSTMRLDD